MSWFFGSSKKKEAPPVTVDPTPIENELRYGQSAPQTQPNFTSLYPDLNGGQPFNSPALPYSLSPHVQPSPAISSSTVTTPYEPVVKEPSNQLESIPFRISPQLQANTDSVRNDNEVSLKEFERTLDRVKKYFDGTEFDYDFNLEKRILREAKMVNGH